MRVASYARVSTEDQAERFGLSSQITELRTLAAEKGYLILEEFSDDGYSGAELDRPALARLRDAVRGGAFDVVLIHDPDRLSRKLVHQLLLLDEFERAGVLLVFKTTPRENTPEGELLLNVKGVLAQYERLKIRERTMRGKREKARRGGLPSGPIPYGYRPDPAIPGRLVVHEEEAAVVRQIFTWLVDERRSVRKIAEELERLGRRAPTGRHWAPSTVKRLLGSEVYAGRMWWNRFECSGGKRRLRPEREWIAIDVPAIVPRWLLERARAQLTRNKTLWSGRPSPRFYLLRGLLKCQCGRPWHGVPYHGRRNYRCTSRDRFFYVESCGSPSRRADALEALVWETVTGILRNPELLAEKLEAYKTTLGVRDVEIQSEAGYIERQLAELDRRERKLIDSFLDSNEMDAATVRAKMAESSSRRNALKTRAEAIQERLAQEHADMARQDAVKRYCARALEGLEALSAEGRRELLLALVDEIVIREGTLEIHGVLPGRELARVLENSVRFPASSVEAGYVLVVPMVST